MLYKVALYTTEQGVSMLEYILPALFFCVCSGYLVKTVCLDRRWLDQGQWAIVVAIFLGISFFTYGFKNLFGQAWKEVADYGSISTGISHRTSIILYVAMFFTALLSIFYLHQIAQSRRHSNRPPSE